ncbi:MAG: DUF2905 family protein [Candidatus Latescibacteria bacterium]|nr:DUF2905 family protein [bacterium]MBD3425334.1 DUF2905 family protein [Candidatus Latescibacterota bacterium]
MRKIFIYAGLILIAVGILMPWLGRFGSLPGDIVIERTNFKFYFPLTSMVILSLVASLIIWLIRR